MTKQQINLLLDLALLMAKDLERMIDEWEVILAANAAKNSP